MDTIPFHLVMFALDIILGFCLFFLTRTPHKKKRTQSHLALFPQNILPQQDELDAPVKKLRLRALVGLALLAWVGLVGVYVIAKLFKANTGQCLAEGLTYHGSAFLVFLAVRLAGRRHFVLGGFSLILALACFGAGFNMLVFEPNRLVVEKYTISSNKIKKPMRIVFVSDIQTDAIRSFEHRILTTVMAQNPDLIILGGDYVQCYAGAARPEQVAEAFQQLLTRVPLSAPLGVFALRGNNDSIDAMKTIFLKPKINPILSSTVYDDFGADMEKGPIDLVLLTFGDSVDGVNKGVFEEAQNFRVIAGHSPSFALGALAGKKESGDLMLAGHTHGGQVYVPFYGYLGYGMLGMEQSKYGFPIPRDKMCGLFTFPNGDRLLVTRGAGVERGWAPRVRFMCPPEISVIDLIPE